LIFTHWVFLLIFCLSDTRALLGESLFQQLGGQEFRYPPSRYGKWLPTLILQIHRQDITSGLPSATHSLMNLVSYESLPLSSVLLSTGNDLPAYVRHFSTHMPKALRKFCLMGLGNDNPR
jgi:hypothetical protein